MSSEGPKHQLLVQFAAVAKAMSHPHRLEILELLSQGERSVDAVAAAAGLPIANASQHLQHLRRAGLVVARKRGKHVLYRVSDDRVIAALTALRRVAEHHVAEVDKVVSGYFRGRDALEAVSRRELLRRMREDAVTVLDVRPAEEFAAGHLPGAVNIPLTDLKRRLRALSPDQEIVAYCRGPYCVLAYEAVALLRKRGFRARRLEDGYPEWRAARMPTEGAPTAARS